MVWVFTALWIGLMPAADVHAASDAGAEVRARHLYHLTKFVEWPASAFADGRAPLRICVVGDAVDLPVELGRLEGRKARGRRIEVTAAGPDGLSHCQVVVFPDGSPGATALADLVAEHALTVGEGGRFVEAGGIFGFVERENEVGFVVDPARARTAGLRISSRLLRLAEIAGAPERPVR